MTTAFRRMLTPVLVLIGPLILTACSAADPAVKSERVEAKPLVADLHRDHGWAAIRAERYAEAASYFQRILKDLPEDDQAQLGLAEAYLGQRRLDDALVRFERLEGTADPALQAKMLQGQGLVQLRQGNIETARGLLERAVEKDSGLWRSWNALGRLRDAEKNYVSAREAYRRAISLNPKTALLHNNLGFSLLASGELAYAEMSLSRALELEPNLEVGLTNLRLALALQGRYGPALAGTSEDQRAEVMNNVGYAALLRGDHQRAKTLFLDAMTVNPGFFLEAKRNLAFLETLVAETPKSP